MAQTPPKTNSGYVFEILKGEALSFRRADMQTPHARAALLTLLGMLFGVDITGHEIHYILVHSPADWRYIALKLEPTRASEKKATLQVFRAEREPGMDSGENAVITHIASVAIH
jgi:hypothetical protein